MNIFRTSIAAAAAALAMSATLTGCSDGKSYAELLTEETHYVNNFLAYQRVVNTIPTGRDFEFETGPNAPYYRLDEDGNVYMQVINPGTPDNVANDDQIIYFRFMRYAMSAYNDGEFPAGDGNQEDMSYSTSWFRYNNLSIQASYQWGAGLQMPLKYLPIDCEVNIVIKSQYGLYDEQANVQAFLYHVRYYPQQT